MDREKFTAADGPAHAFAFGDFTLDLRERSLRRDGRPVELGSRYFDALALLMARPGALVSKDRFMDEVWRGIPVTDEALTQCIRTLRRALGDEAGNPRFIETVPKHGYRFVAKVEALAVGGSQSGSIRAPSPAWRTAGQLAAAATGGGALAGITGGLFYGLVAASGAAQRDFGAGSLILVVMALALAVGTLGGAGVGIGMALARVMANRADVWLVAGGALGGLGVGGAVNLLGLDGIALLTGSAPSGLTGFAEGIAIGALTGLAVRIALGNAARPRRATLCAIAIGAIGGALLALAGGRLLAGSLLSLQKRFPESRLPVGELGRIVGDPGFGPVAAIATAALEAAVFVGCIVAITLWRHRRS